VEEMTRNGSERRRLFWLLQTAFWLVYWVVWVYFRPGTISNLTSFAWSTVYYSVGIGGSFLLRFFYKKHRVHRLPPIQIILILFVSPLLTAAAWVGVGRLIAFFLSGTFLFGGVEKFLGGIWEGYYVLTIWSTLYVGFKVYEEWILQKQDAERARSLAQSAQLEVLRYQINPHFLFNTLSALRALTTSNPSKANEVVTKISEFLRYSLAEGNHSEVPLAREIQIIQHYVDIEQLQYEENLRVEFRIDPLAEDYPIPIFLIHPLVENAVKHGMQTSSLPLKITVGAEVVGDELHISVANTGKWIEPSSDALSDGTQTGLANVRKRLQHFYPKNHNIEIREEEGTVRIEISLKKLRVTDHASTV
jgi:two-component system LytT family sensor kinase